MSTIGNRMRAIADEMSTLAEFDRLNAAQEKRYKELDLEFEDLRRQEAHEEIRKQAADPRNRLPGDNSSPAAPTVLFRGDPWHATIDPFDTGSEIRSRTLNAIEAWNADDELKEAATETVERTAETNEPGVAKHVLVTSDPAYVSAFQKFIKEPETGYQSFTDAERAAWTRAKEHQRALALSGTVVPSPLDPSIVLSNAGVIDPMRGVARIEQTTSTTKRFVTSAGVTASWDSEAQEVSDDSPSLTEVTITPSKAQAFVAASFEAFDDQPNLGMEVAKMFADAKARLEGAAFIAGTGSGQPKGIQTALDGGASELAPATAEQFVAADVYSTLEALPARWRGNNATWQAELSTLNQIHRQWNPSGSEPPLFNDAGDRLLRLPVVQNSSIDAYSDLNPAASADNFLLFLGDWNEFIVLDRVGMSIEYVPLLYNTANNLPGGQRGWLAWWRVGSDVTTINAFRVMSVPTTA